MPSGWCTCWSAACWRAASSPRLRSRPPGTFFATARRWCSRGSPRLQRLGNVLQDAGIKIDSVASSIATKSGRAMIEALIDGERRGPVLAQLAKGRCAPRSGPVRGAGRPVRRPPGRDVPAAPGPHRSPRGDDHQAGRPDQGDDDALSRPGGPAHHRPRDRPARRRRGDLRDGVTSAEFFADAAHLASWTGRYPSNHESAGKRHSGRRRTATAPAVHPGRVRLVSGPPGRVPQIALPPARDEMGRLSQPGREEESDRRGRPRPDRHHLAHPGHRKALPGPRRRLLHHPPGPERETRRLIAKLEALGHHVTLQPAA